MRRWTSRHTDHRPTPRRIAHDEAGHAAHPQPIRAMPTKVRSERVATSTAAIAREDCEALRPRSGVRHARGYRRTMKAARRAIDSRQLAIGRISIGLQRQLLAEHDHHHEVSKSISHVDPSTWRRSPRPPPRETAHPGRSTDATSATVVKTGKARDVTASFRAPATLLEARRCRASPKRQRTRQGTARRRIAAPHESCKGRSRRVRR